MNQTGGNGKKNLILDPIWPICNFIEIALRHGCPLVNLSGYHLMQFKEHLYRNASTISIFELLYF